WQPDRSRHARRNSGASVRRRTLKNLRDCFHKTTRDTRPLQAIDPILCAYLLHALCERRADQRALTDSLRVRLQRFVVGQMVEAKCAHASAPLFIASNGNYQGAVGG